MEEMKELLLLHRNSKTYLGIALEERILDKYAELEAENKRLKQQAIAGQKVVKAMDGIDYTCPCLEDCHDCMEIIAQYKSGTQEARKC